jgi:TonB family protein
MKHGYILLILTVSLGAMATPQEPRPPLSDQDILVMVGRGEPSETILQSIAARGINFQPTPAYLDWLRARGAKDMLIDALRDMSPRPFSKIELLRSIPTRGNSERLTQEVHERGIDFEPDKEYLQTLRRAGARETLLQAVRDAKRGMPFVAPKANRPYELKLTNALVSPPLVEGKEATLICSPSDGSVPVFAVPNDLGKIATFLRCGEKVTFVERVTVPPGIDKIRYADGKEGFVSNAYLESSVANITAPTLITKTEAPYTPEGRRDRIEGIVKLIIVVDVQGNVSDVQETSKPLGDGLDQSAIDTVKTWKFKPATRDGTPVAVRTFIDIHFRLGPRGH